VSILVGLAASNLGIIAIEAPAYLVVLEFSAPNSHSIVVV
jgi:hypothetical protein